VADHYTPRKDGAVLFYGRNRPYFELSNFYQSHLYLDDHVWQTVEHYYMAQKTLDPNEQTKIRNAPTAATAKAMGRRVKLRPNWDNIKFDIMFKACYAKFSQNRDLKQLLLDTGERPLHEDTKKDNIWGGGPNNPNGQDLLGKVLVKVRNTLRKELELETFEV